MSPQFVAKPPLAVQPRALANHLWQLLRRARYILWQIVVPFNSRPEEIDPLPEPQDQVTDSHVQQCQWIFDQAEERRVHLEQKAQSTFGLMVFLVPLLASLFVFIINRTTTSGLAIRTLAIGALFVSAVLLLLGFISAVRAVSVKSIETLYLDSVIDKTGQFREYNKAFHARGLLYCAAMNQAINDHLAQFVKGAHLLTAGAVIALVIAAVPTSFVVSSPPTSPTQTKIVGPVEVSSPELSGIREEVGTLKEDIGKLIGSSEAAVAILKPLQAKVERIDARLNKIQKVLSISPGGREQP